MGFELFESKGHINQPHVPGEESRQVVARVETLDDESQGWASVVASERYNYGNGDLGHPLGHAPGGLRPDPLPALDQRGAGDGLLPQPVRRERLELRPVLRRRGKRRGPRRQRVRVRLPQRRGRLRLDRLLRRLAAQRCGSLPGGDGDTRHVRPVEASRWDYTVFKAPGQVDPLHQADPGPDQHRGSGLRVVDLRSHDGNEHDLPGALRDHDGPVGADRHPRSGHLPGHPDQPAGGHQHGA